MLLKKTLIEYADYCIEKIYKPKKVSVSRTIEHVICYNQNLKENAELKLVVTHID